MAALSFRFSLPLRANHNGEHHGEHEQHAGAAPAVPGPDAGAEHAHVASGANHTGDNRGRTIASGIAATA